VERHVRASQQDPVPSEKAGIAFIEIHFARKLFRQIFSQMLEKNSIQKQQIQIYLSILDNHFALSYILKPFDFFVFLSLLIFWYF
jgi:hypothetical protein